MTNRLPHGLATLGAGVVLLVLASGNAMAELSSVSVTLTSDGFQPKKISIVPDTKVKLKVKNASSRPAEFESYDLNREKVIPPHATATLYIGPLGKATYKFFNDFDKSISGTIEVK